MLKKNTYREPSDIKSHNIDRQYHDFALDLEARPSETNIKNTSRQPVIQHLLN